MASNRKPTYSVGGRTRAHGKPRERTAEQAALHREAVILRTQVRARGHLSGCSCVECARMRDMIRRAKPGYEPIVLGPNDRPAWRNPPGVAKSAERVLLDHLDGLVPRTVYRATHAPREALLRRLEKTPCRWWTPLFELHASCATRWTTTTHGLPTQDRRYDAVILTYGLYAADDLLDLPWFADTLDPRKRPVGIVTPPYAGDLAVRSDAMPQKEVAALLSVRQSAVSQIMARASAYLRDVWIGRRNEEIAAAEIDDYEEDISEMVIGA